MATIIINSDDRSEGTLQSWNVAFQRQLPHGFSAEAAYVGSRGINLVADLDTNASLIYGSGNAGRPRCGRCAPRSVPAP